MPVEQQSPPVLLQPQTGPVTTGEGDRILIIDDEPSIVSALSAQLQQQGFVVSLAATGSQGRAAAHRERPQLIILDLRLPDIDGFTLCQELADDPNTCGTPVILLSAMVRPDIIRRSRAVGCQYFVRKPYDPGALLVLIHHSLEESRRWSAPL
ncbi:MAG TPA: response regulator [Pirellulales bacterium]|nr:response regulator [Pirellulales bacterium]